MGDVFRPGLLVQIVYILGAEGQSIFHPLLQVCERDVSRVWLGFSSKPPPGVELPDQPGIASPSMRGGDFLDPVVPP